MKHERHKQSYVHSYTNTDKQTHFMMIGCVLVRMLRIQFSSVNAFHTNIYAVTIHELCSFVYICVSMFAHIFAPFVHIHTHSLTHVSRFMFFKLCLSYNEDLKNGGSKIYVKTTKKSFFISMLFFPKLA